jgi:hypothetical protein
MHNKHISKNSALELIAINTDVEAFNDAIQFSEKPTASWVQVKWRKVLNLFE